MKRGLPEAGQTLTQSQWESLLNEARRFVHKYIHRLRWRGSYDGVLPDGYDVESIAAESVVQFLQQSTATSNSPVPLGRFVWRLVDRLFHRKENFLLVNEPDLAPVYHEGDLHRAVELIPDISDNPAEALLRKEAEAEAQTLQTNFSLSLGPDKRLKSLFTCYINGIWQPRHIAPQLRVSVPVAKNLQKRLRHRLRQFQQKSRA